jgi:hypothetical protein
MEVPAGAIKCGHCRSPLKARTRATNELAKFLVAFIFCGGPIIILLILALFGHH